jgi:hypothetical protein
MSTEGVEVSGLFSILTISPLVCVIIRLKTADGGRSHNGSPSDPEPVCVCASVRAYVRASCVCRDGVMTTHARRSGLLTARGVENAVLFQYFESLVRLPAVTARLKSPSTWRPKPGPAVRPELRTWFVCVCVCVRCVCVC